MEDIIIKDIHNMKDLDVKKDIWDVVSYIDRIFTSAIKIWASDIHISYNFV